MPKAILAVTPANATIQNVAKATYKSEDGIPLSVISNTAEMNVGQVFAIRIKTDGTSDNPGQIVEGNPGQEVFVPYTLINMGNGVDSYTYTIDGGDFRQTRLIIDTNQNGIFDDSDSEYSNESPPELKPGETVALLVAGTIPADQSSGRFAINLSGFSNGHPPKTDTDNVAAVDIIADGFLIIDKSVNLDQVLPRETIEFTLNIRNPGSRAILASEISDADFDNDNFAEGQTGVLISDAIPAETTFTVDTVIGTPEEGFPVFAGSDDLWKLDETQTDSVLKVGFFIPGDLDSAILGPKEEGNFSFTVLVDEGALPGKISNLAEVQYNNLIGVNIQPSNTIEIEILPLVKIVVDDTDDNGAFTGSGTPDDPNDVMNIEESELEVAVEFRNEVWNLGNVNDVIQLTHDIEASLNLPEDIQIVLLSEEGIPLVDTDGNDQIDTGSLSPGENFPFITQVTFSAATSTEPVTVAIRGASQIDPSITDITFDIISSAATKEINPDNVRIQAIILVDGTAVEEALEGQRILAHEFDDSGNHVRSRIFLTNEEGTILFDEFGEPSPITNWMRNGFQYRLTLDGEFRGFSYYLTPAFFKSDFDAVTEPGETFTRGEVTITVDDDGSRLLETPLDPAGFVFDSGPTKERINGACATFYRCDDGPDCTTFTPVDPSRLDLLPDGISFQENPQVTGPLREGGRNVGTGPGAFQFQFAAFRPSDEGYYFVGIDFDCGEPTSDPTLANDFSPVELNRGTIWDPFSGDLYTGAPFFVDINFPQTSLLEVPLVSDDLNPIKGEKVVDRASALAGEVLTFTITLHNDNPGIIFNPQVEDTLPVNLQYRVGSTFIDGSPAGDPEIDTTGLALSWSLPNLDPDQFLDIKFQAQVIENSETGSHVNSASVSGSIDANDTIRLSSDPFQVSFEVEEIIPLVVEKNVTPSAVSIGDLLRFTITAQNNNTNRTVFNPVVIDQLPPILRYRKGSTQINEIRSDDPQISEDARELTWSLPHLEAGQVATISFFAAVTGAGRTRTYDNAAFAHGFRAATIDPNTIPLTSNTDLARFRVVQGVFTDRSYIIGKVFFDDNRNRLQDENEQGIEGVKVYTEFGRYVVTDSEGKYHLDNVKPGSHILKLDSTTLPPLSVPEHLSNRHFENGEAICVDLFPGDIFKANFGLIAKAPVETTESWQNPMAGLVTFERTFTDLQRDANSGVVRLRHLVTIKNTSELPLYEFVYSEQSSYPPISGSCYLNNAPYEDPKNKAEKFFWLLPLLEPESSFEILFASEIPEEALFARAQLTFQKEPFSPPINLVAKLPVALTLPFERVYHITSYFDANETDLSPDGHLLVHRLGLMLSRIPFDRLMVRVQEYSDAAPSTELRKQLVQDETLKNERSTAVKSVLENSLIEGTEIIFE